MKQHILFLILFLFSLNAFSQKKVRVRYEYDVEKDAKTKKLKKDLYTITQYDTLGRIKEIVSYGRITKTYDTSVVKMVDGREQITIYSKNVVNIKKIGRVEKFSPQNDSIIFSSRYDVQEQNDTVWVSRKYSKLASDIYFYESKKINGLASDSSIGYCDAEFADIFFEKGATLIYDENKRLVRKEFADDKSDTVRDNKTVYYSYNDRGKLAMDSTVQNGEPTMKNFYLYDKQNRLQSVKKNLLRLNRSIQYRYSYNEHGELLKKHQQGQQTTQFTYIYYKP